MPQVTMPDGAVVDLPDDLSPELAQRLKAFQAGTPRQVRQAPASVVARKVPSNFNPDFLGDVGDIAGVVGVNGIVRPALGGAAALLARVGNTDDDSARETGRNLIPEYKPGENIARVQKQVGEAVAPVGRGLSALMAKLRGVSPLAADTVGELGQTVGDIAAVTPAAGAAEGAVGLARSTGRAATGAAKAIPDYLSGARTARKVAQGAAGENLPAIREALAKAPDNLTAAQAAYGIDQDTFQSLGDLAARNDTKSGYRMLEDAQETERKALLAANAPDVGKAKGVRSSASGPLYEQANSTNVAMTPALAATLERVEPAVLREAERLSREAGNPFTFGDVVKNGAPKYVPGDVLHYVKLALDKAAQPGAGIQSGIGSVAPAITGGLAKEYTAALSDANPIYGVARDVHRDLSAPVNQGQVMEHLQTTLRDSRTQGERAGPFLNAVDKGHESVLKRATGQRRFSDISEVLTEPQMAAVNQVRKELEREETLGRQARAGAGGLSRVLEKNKAVVPTLPQWFSAKTAVANKGFGVLRGSIQRKALDKLVEGMRSGKSALKLMQDLSGPEQAAIKSILDGMPTGALAAGTVATNLDSSEK